MTWTDGFNRSFYYPSTISKLTKVFKSSSMEKMNGIFTTVALYGRILLMERPFGQKKPFPPSFPFMLSTSL